MSSSSLTPREGRLHPRQLRAIVSHSLRQELRPGRDPNSGAQVHPMRQLVISMGLMGLLLAANVGRMADPSSYLVVLFALVFATLALAAVPETHDAREARVAILQSKPVSRVTQAWASATVALLETALIAGCMGLLPLLALGWHFQRPWWLVAGLLASLVIGSFAMLLIGRFCILWVAMRAGVARVRLVSQSILALIMLATLAVSMLGLAGDTIGLAGKLSVTSPAVRWLPSTWFADLLQADLGWRANLERLGALLLLGVALWTTRRTARLPYHEALAEKLLVGETAATTRSLPVRLLQGLARLPLLGPWLLPARVRAVATVVLAVSGREEMSRLRAFGPRVMELGVFAVGLVGPLEGAFWVGLLALLGLNQLAAGVETVRQCSNAEAAWVFRAMPLGPGEIVRGTLAAVVLRYQGLSWLLVSAALLMTYALPAALLLSLLFLSVGHFLIALQSLMRPGLPLAAELRAGAGAGAVALLTLSALGVGVGYMLLVFVVGHLGATGLVVGGACLTGNLLVNYALAQLAAIRLAHAEQTRAA